MTQNVYIGEYADGEDNIAYAVRADSDREAMTWLNNQALADAVYPADVVHRSEAVAWLRKRAEQGQMVAGNIPEADKIEQQRIGEEWDQLLATIRHDSEAIRQWIQLQRSFFHPRARMFVVRCVLAGKAFVADVVIDRAKSAAVDKAKESIRLWEPDATVIACEVDYVGMISDESTDQRALEILTACKRSGYQLLGQLQVLGSLELDDATIEDQSVRESNTGRSSL